MRSSHSFLSFSVSISLLSFGAACGDDKPGPREDGGPRNPIVDGGFVCFEETSEACLNDIHYSCEDDGEFLRPVRENCAEMGLICVDELWCVVCRPGEVACMGPENNTAVRCRDDGSGWEDVEDCGERGPGFACVDGQCQNLCEVALANRSYVGCEFWGVDLDNAAIAVGRDASSQQYAVVVSNPGRVTSEVWVEVNDAPYGMDPVVREVTRVPVPGGDLEVLELPRREVDGSSSNSLCLPTDRTCPTGETCICSRMDSEPPCFCRVDVASDGMNDGTHSALTSQAYRIRSTLPIIAYQFNPLSNFGVFSNDASLLLPTSAIERRYTVVAWPQTIANSDTNPDADFDPSRDDEDLRASLTIVGTAERTSVHIELGDRVVKVVGFAPYWTTLGSSGVLDLEIGPFDVINLETEGLNGDFTGTLVESSSPVAVFAGSEASDVPRFETYATRQCCADHLEEQLFPDQSLGRRFIIGRMPPRSTSLNAAFVTADSTGEFNEPEWVRVVAVDEGFTVVTTTLPSPDDRIMLGERESVILRASQDFIMESDKPIAVLQALPSQEAVGIQSEYPGGDPAIIAVPPTEQYRNDYVFLTPDLYAFDFVVISAPRRANVLLDGAPLDPRTCSTSPADGIERLPSDPPPNEVIHRCQFSFPDVVGLPNVRVEDGIQNDGVHTIQSDMPVGIVVYGFDSFVSYAYAGGLDLDIIN
jgi:hypothetical protein